MKFDRQQLEIGLCRVATNAPVNFRIHLFDVVSSTNQALWRLIDQGADEGTVAIALQQHAGRGQWGRQWQSLSGGLYLSLALTPNLAAQNSEQLTLVSAWGIAIALQRYGVPVGVKWPNDLVVQGQKLGGILTETRVAQGLIHRAIVGVGINWANPVPEGGVNLQTVLQTLLKTKTVERSQLAVASSDTASEEITSLEMLGAIVLSGIMNAYHQWQHQGIESILPGYQQLLINIGQSVKVNDHFGNNTLGTVAGVSTTGDLRVQLPSDWAAASPGSESLEIELKPGAISLGYGRTEN